MMRLLCKRLGEDGGCKNASKYSFDEYLLMTASD
jgi:hypothetical protein